MLAPLAVGLVASSTVLDTGVASAAASTVSVPGSIDGSGSADVTGALQSFLDSVPDGSTVVFPSGARYRVEGTLELSGRRDLTIEGHGSTFFATSEGDRNRAHWRVQGSSGITIRDVAVVGANEGAGVDGVFDVEREAQHGFGVLGSDSVLLERVSVRDVYGDFVYISKGEGGVPSRNVTVRSSTFEGSGRQGISITSAEDVWVQGNSIGDVRRSMFDLEPFSDRLVIRRVHIVNNTVGVARFAFVAAGGAPATVEDIEIRGNRLTGMLPSVAFEGHEGSPRRRITVADNVTDQSNNRPVFSFTWVEGASVTGNVVPFDSQKEGYVPFAVKSRSSCGITVEGNQFGDAALLDTDNYRCAGEPEPVPAPAPAPSPAPTPAPGSSGGAAAGTAPATGVVEAPGAGGSDGAALGDATMTEAAGAAAGATGTAGQPAPDGSAAPADGAGAAPPAADGSVPPAGSVTDGAGNDISIDAPPTATTSPAALGVAVALVLALTLALLVVRRRRLRTASVDSGLEPQLEAVEQDSFGIAREDLDQWLEGLWKQQTVQPHARPTNLPRVRPLRAPDRESVDTR